jgi:hypothetical protein
MKKFIAIGITALGSFGLIGLGTTAAFAAPTAHQQVCTSAAAQTITQNAAMTTAQAALTNANVAAGLANTAVGVAEGIYTTDALAVISDVDNGVTQGVLTDATNAFNASITSFVNSVVANSGAKVIAFNAQNAVDQLGLQLNVLSLLSAGC